MPGSQQARTAGWCVFNWIFFRNFRGPHRFPPDNTDSMKYKITAFLAACTAICLAPSVLAQEAVPSANHAGCHKRSPAERFKMLDTDGSGTLSKEEFLAPAAKAPNPEKARKHREKRFAKLDTNKDGVISLQEFLAGEKKHKHHGHKGDKPAAS